MASISLHRWQTEGKRRLDEIAAAHAAVGGSGRGRRYATQEINHAYAVLLTSQFQRFCRDLHTEAVEHIVAGVTPVPVQSVLRTRLLEGRKLDQGNPNPSNLGSDFGPFGFKFWAAVRASHARSDRWQRLLDDLTGWRNAIAHQDFAGPILTPPPPLQRRHVERWRSACWSLARQFDTVVRDQVAALVGKPPW
jgi:hypothetical protein